MIIQGPTKRRTLALAGLLTLLTVAVFSPVRRHDFIAFDDDTHVTNNPVVQRGLTWGGVRWAFAQDMTCHSGGQEYWQPLTYVSHMLDVDLFGLDPAGHHLMNVLLHTLNAVLVLWLLHGLTGALWPSAFAAALFAVHPLRVESVAWVAERKDVLSALFALLTIGAYATYARYGGISRYGLSLLLYAASLMSKPAGVTLPAVLLLLDLWPLGRLDRRTWRRSLLEKIPFLLLALACVAVTLIPTTRLELLSLYPFGVTLRNALAFYAGSILKFAYPSTLFPLYPNPGAHLPRWELLLSILLLAAVSVAAFRRLRTAPWLASGWLWFLVLLMPSVGIGEWALADRMTYLPHLGLDLALAWGAAALLARFPAAKGWILAGAAAALLALSVRTRAQLAYWQDTQTLTEHIIASGGDNPIAQSALADSLAAKGNVQAAIAHYEIALRASPIMHNIFAKTRNNLGNVLLGQGRDAEAVIHFEAALKIRPDFPEAHYNLGRAFLAQGRTGEALAHFQEAARLQPGRAEFQEAMGVALTQAGRLAEAEGPLREAVRLEPGNPKALNNLGAVLARRSRLRDAEACFLQALEAEPGYPEAARNLDACRRDLLSMAP